HLEEAIEFALHLIHLLAHVQYDLDAGEIHAQVTRQFQNHLQPFNIFLGVKSDVAFGTRRFEQPFAFVKPQCLLMDTIMVSDGTDCIAFGTLFHNSLPLDYSNPIVTRGFSGLRLANSRSRFFESSSMIFGNTILTSTY